MVHLNRTSANTQLGKSLVRPLQSSLSMACTHTYHPRLTGRFWYLHWEIGLN